MYLPEPFSDVMTMYFRFPLKQKKPIIFLSEIHLAAGYFQSLIDKSAFSSVFQSALTGSKAWKVDVVENIKQPQLKAFVSYFTNQQMCPDCTQSDICKQKDCK